ncbi:MAG: SOS response-associated peptidase family protein [Magnetospirillum gryphiswaldense]|nr:SOS response-associated peptidase family protein [Magnetospirillum gryphiswaldense]
MCSRFELNGQVRSQVVSFGLTLPPPWPNATEFRPTDRALVVGRAEGRLLSWGLRVAWDKAPVINARMESVPDKPLFRRLLGKRILVPASAWWEWDAAKTKMRLSRSDGGLMTFAGLYDGDTFVILTRTATPDLQGVHDRMPVLADHRWLAGGAPQPVEAEISVTAEARPQGDLFG